MEKTKHLFLEALKSALLNEHVSWQEELSLAELNELLQMAQIHKVLPMIYEAVYECPAIGQVSADVLRAYKRQSVLQVTGQVMRTSCFLQLYQKLQAAGIQPLVVKGLICRNIYPQPDSRLSGDEDILIKAEWFQDCHTVMSENRLVVIDDGKDIYKTFEVSYSEMDGPLHIEVHKQLFMPESDAYGWWNGFFEGVFERSRQELVQGVPVWTLGYTDHLFYLICHALKHFLHSGFGIRQVCDIIMYANAYGDQIDWKYVFENCQKIRAEYFAATLFQIGEKYLVFDPEKACFPEAWKALQEDETAMLQDLLSAGAYGSSDMSRKHSSNITLNAVAEQKNSGKIHSKKALLKTVFPAASSLDGRYLYLKKYPFLLPIAWIERILKYQKETAAVGNRSNRAADSIKIGNQRIELLRQYHVIR